MIVFKDGSWQQLSGHPNGNYLAGYKCEQPLWVVDDNSELADKIISADSEWEPVENETGGLIDIIPAGGQAEGTQDNG